MIEKIFVEGFYFLDTMHIMMIMTMGSTAFGSCTIMSLLTRDDVILYAEKSGYMNLEEIQC